MTEHQHHFPIVTRWRRDDRSGMYYQMIVGHEDCSCGLSWAEHLTDLRKNLETALAYVRRHRTPWNWR